MVTNNLSFLTYADKVVVLKMGEVAAQLSKEEMNGDTVQDRLIEYGIKLLEVPNNK